MVQIETWIEAAKTVFLRALKVPHYNFPLQSSVDVHNTRAKQSPTPFCRTQEGPAYTWVINVHTFVGSLGL